MGNVDWRVAPLDASAADPAPEAPPRLLPGTTAFVTPRLPAAPRRRFLDGMERPPTRLVGWAAGIVIWTALALLGVVETVMWLRLRGEPVALGSLMLRSLVDWYACGIFIPLLVLATRRWPIDRRHLAERLSLHLLVIVVASAGKIALMVPVRRALALRGPATLAEGLAGNLITEMMAFGAVAAALHALEFYRRYRERETVTAQLQARLSDAQLRTR
jgi:two-component system, LytTR family, sensor kinase